MEIHVPAGAIAQDIECLVDELYGVWLRLRTQCTRAEMARILTVLASVEEFEDAEPTIRTILQNGAFLGKFSEPLPENWEAYVDDGAQPPNEKSASSPSGPEAQGEDEC